MSVPISVLLQRKGSDCHTIGPDASLADVTHRLAEHGIGALVVSGNGTTVDGIISERDVVRALAREGEQALSARVGDVMSTSVRTCSPTSVVDDVMGLMSTRRVRHIPVIEEGRLTGIVSIGDIVKWRIDELAETAERLQEYVTGTY